MIKSWRDSAEKSPSHRYDIALTDEYAPRIERALLGLLDTINVPDLIDRYGSSIVKADGDDERADLIRRIIGGISIRDNMLDDLRAAVEQATIEGMVTGAHAAVEQLGAHAVTVPDLFGPAAVDINWDAWKPGDPIAVGEVVAGALRENLADLGITVRGISDTVLDTVGNHIGEGLFKGWGSDKIEREIRDLIGSRSRAERIAHTEVARAQTTASLLVYRANGVTEYELLLSDGACAECVALAEENPYQLDDDTARVPIHPFCRCADAPVVDSIDPSQIETRDADGSEPDENPEPVELIGADESKSLAEHVADFEDKHPGVKLLSFDRDSINPETGRLVIAKLDDMLTRYPNARLAVVEVSDRLGMGISAQVTGMTSPGSVPFMRLSSATMRATPEQLARRIAPSIESGFFRPNPVGFSDIEQTIVHEFGHVIDYNTGTAARKFVKPTQNQLLREAGIKPSDSAAGIWLRENLSGYSRKNTAEAFGEMFADVEMNGPNASPLSIAVVTKALKALEGISYYGE